MIKKYDFLIFDKYTSVDFILDNDVTIKLDGTLSSMRAKAYGAFLMESGDTALLF